MHNLSRIIILVSLLAGCSITAWGLFHFQWPQVLPWINQDVLIRYISFLSVGAIFIFLSSWWSRRSALYIGGCLVLVCAILVGALWPLLVTAWFGVASVLLGRAVLDALGINDCRNSWLINLLVGVGIYGTVVGLLAHFPVSYIGLYAAALALPIVLWWRLGVDDCRYFLEKISKNKKACFSVNKLDVAIAIVALVYFVVALMPEVGYDALATHLFVPAHMALRHQWGFDVSTYVWAVLPMLGDWIFSIGYILAGETAARLINIGFIYILGWLVRDLVLWAGGSILGARWAVLLFLSTPLTFTEGSTLFIESIWASFVVASTLIFLRIVTSSTDFKLLPVAGILLGSALAAKAITFTILPVLFFLLVWRYRARCKSIHLPFLLIGLCIFFAMGAIPYVTAWELTGNPVFPMFNKVFQSPFFPSVNFNNSLFNDGLRWDVLYRVTFKTGKYLEASIGASGFQWLLLFIPALIVLMSARHVRGGVLFLIGVFTVVGVFYSQSYLRYVFHSSVVLTACIGIAMSSALSVQGMVRNLWIGVATITVALNLLFFCAGAPYKGFAIKSIGDQSLREDYLLGRLPIRNAVELINNVNVGRTPVAVFSQPLVAGLSADGLYPNWYNSAFHDEVLSIKSEYDAVNILMNRSVNYIILDSNWKQGGDENQTSKVFSFIEKTTEKLMDYGAISVRKIKSGYKFKQELLVNPEFMDNSGWSFSQNTKIDEDTGKVQVNVASPVTQGVSVSKGRQYLNTVVARCAKESTQGRVQINWHDIQGEFVSTNIKVFDCYPDWTEYVMEVVTPENASTAVVYTTGHTLTSLEFKSNSLRQ